MCLDYCILATIKFKQLLFVSSHPRLASLVQGQDINNVQYETFDGYTNTLQGGYDAEREVIVSENVWCTKLENP